MQGTQSAEREPLFSLPTPSIPLSFWITDSALIVIYRSGLLKNVPVRLGRSIADPIPGFGREEISERLGSAHLGALQGACTTLKVLHCGESAAIAVSPVRNSLGEIVGTIARVENEDAGLRSDPSTLSVNMVPWQQSLPLQTKPLFLEEHDSLMARLINLESTFQAILDALSDAVLVVVRGRVVRWNRQAAVVCKSLVPTQVVPVEALGEGEPWDTTRQMLHDFDPQNAFGQVDVQDPAGSRTWTIQIRELAAVCNFEDGQVLTLRETPVEACVRPAQTKSVGQVTVEQA